MFSSYRIATSYSLEVISLQTIVSTIKPFVLVGYSDASTHITLVTVNQHIANNNFTIQVGLGLCYMANTPRKSENKRHTKQTEGECYISS